MNTINNLARPIFHLAGDLLETYRNWSKNLDSEKTTSALAHKQMPQSQLDLFSQQALKRQYIIQLRTYQEQIFFGRIVKITNRGRIILQTLNAKTYTLLALKDIQVITKAV